MGVGAVGLVVGTIFGLKVGEKNREIDSICPTGQPCPPQSVADYNSAVADAKKEVEAGRMTQQNFDLNTKPEILEKNTEEFVKKCDVPAMTSRQVRVLEVCHKEEADCEPFLDCLSHLSEPAK